MLRVFLLIVLAITANCKTEPTNFNYDNHGLDW